MKTLTKTIIVALLAVLSLQSKAQTAGDRLFAQGQKLQLTQTVSAQNKAIAKFAAAKKAYDSATKKSMCDNQIAICKSNIRLIRRKAKTVTTKKAAVEEEKKETEQPAPAAAPKEPVELYLSVSSMEFKASGKKKDNQEVVVNCNYDDWTYTYPDWISVTKNGNKLTLKAKPNKTSEERSGVVTVTCYDEKAELMVYQKNKFSLKSLIGK